MMANFIYYQVKEKIVSTRIYEVISDHEISENQISDIVSDFCSDVEKIEYLNTDENDEIQVSCHFVDEKIDSESPIVIKKLYENGE